MCHISEKLYAEWMYMCLMYICACLYMQGTLKK